MQKIILISLFLFTLSVAQGQVGSIKPGEVWLDTDGNPINAHGAGILKYKNTYYLYGEVKKGTTWLVPNQIWECYRVPAGGVSCYSSKDLLNWKYEGLALAAITGNPASDLDTGNVIERPKVVYNKSTGKFVMWMHIDSKDYSYARSGVAVGDSPAGPFNYISSVRPNGNLARDMTLFQDDNGKVYHFYSSEKGNATMRICLLADDYLSHTTNEKIILVNKRREAPAVFKYKSRYYLITSGTTGWSPNAATYAVANEVLGEWTEKGSPCVGLNADRTFNSQSTYIFPVPGKRNRFIFLADRWSKTNLQDSRMVWLPLRMKNGVPEITWKDSWSF